MQGLLQLRANVQLKERTQRCELEGVCLKNTIGGPREIDEVLWKKTR